MYLACSWPGFNPQHCIRFPKACQEWSQSMLVWPPNKEMHNP